MGVHTLSEAETSNQKWEVQRLGFCIEANLREDTVALSGKLFECPEVSAAIANAAMFLIRHQTVPYRVTITASFSANISGIAAFRQLMSTFLVRCDYSEGFLNIEHSLELAVTGKQRAKQHTLKHRGA